MDGDTAAVEICRNARERLDEPLCGLECNKVHSKGHISGTKGKSSPKKPSLSAQHGGAVGGLETPVGSS